MATITGPGSHVKKTSFADLKLKALGHRSHDLTKFSLPKNGRTVGGSEIANALNVGEGKCGWLDHPVMISSQIFKTRPESTLTGLRSPGAGGKTRQESTDSGCGGGGGNRDRPLPVSSFTTNTGIVRCNCHDEVAKTGRLGVTATEQAAQPAIASTSPLPIPLSPETKPEPLRTTRGGRCVGFLEHFVSML
ncbi:unnamed protein product [Mesocestoides corti]|uniref:Uncharacterized protein n=1 Tax=Mesocestoides corti TaxID=53468 RepID=A0A0R3UH95_MESCO|nr:unnamed protein product [Mesocestoides corti]